jgi:hypothetical protein
MRRRSARWSCLLLACACGLLAAAQARASYEEFSTLNVAREEADDENLLDHVLVELPLDWFDEWERATRAFRSSQGCFTSGQWYIDHELKIQIPMGDTTYLDLGIRDVSDDESTYGWTQPRLRPHAPHGPVGRCASGRRSTEPAGPGPCGTTARPRRRCRSRR